ncbi:MAG TPA: hypothetical protein VMA37_10955 [Acetobacteraceae bacterium]|nr:hypothetical protein [Acetobacteraceae bacterium]
MKRYIRAAVATVLLVAPIAGCAGALYSGDPSLEDGLSYQNNIQLVPRFGPAGGGQYIPEDSTLRLVDGTGSGR